MSETPPSLQMALLEAQQAIATIPKESRNEFDKFDYASAETIIRDCRVALHGAGLVAYADGNTVHDFDPSQNGANNSVGMLDATFVLAHPASGETRQFVSQMPFTLRKGWPAEKAVAASLTHALKFWLCRLLLVPRVDKDAELDAVGDRDYEPPIPAVPKPAPPKPTAAEPAQPKPPATTLDPRVPAERSLVSVGKMLLDMAGGDKGRAAEICGSIHGVKSLRDIGDVERAWGGTVEAYNDWLAERDSAEVA